MNNENVIKFKAQVSKVQTMVDGGLRIVLDLPETAIEQVSQLMKVKQMGAILEVAAVAVMVDPLITELEKQS